MKKIALFLVLCLIALCGCNSNTGEIVETPDTPVLEKESSIVGLWTHKDYPDAYSIVVHSLEDGIISLSIEAVKGDYDQIATADIESASFENNKTKFIFIDSFNNSGLCEIAVNGDEMSVSYETNAPYQGGWCIDAGAGTYVKSAKPYVSPDNNNGLVEEDLGTENMQTIPASTYFDPVRYVKVIGYSLGEDVYDKEIFYEFDDPSEPEFIHGNYSDFSYGRDQFGTYKILPSDNSSYNFKLFLNYADEHKEVFYVKTVLPRTVYDFYLEDGTQYARFENYDNYAVKRYSPDGTTYHIRYEHEYQQYERVYGTSHLDSPFTDIY